MVLGGCWVGAFSWTHVFMAASRASGSSSIVVLKSGRDWSIVLRPSVQQSFMMQTNALGRLEWRCCSHLT